MICTQCKEAARILTLNLDSEGKIDKATAQGIAERHCNNPGCTCQHVSDRLVIRS